MTCPSTGSGRCPCRCHGAPPQAACVCECPDGLRAYTEAAIAASCYGPVWPPAGVEPYYVDDSVCIIHGDCREVLPKLGPVDLVLTDPDYGVGIDFSKTRQRGQRGHIMNGRHQEAVALTEDEALELATQALQLVKTTHGVVFWAGAWPRLKRFGLLLEEHDWTIRHLGVWYKPNGSGVSGHGLARRWEPWLWIARARAKRKGEWNALPDCIDVSRVMAHMHEDAGGHPTQKPLELMRRLLRFLSMPGDIILDPFMGSGTTLRAAKDLGRRAIGIEIEEKYCKLAAERMAQAALPLAQPPPDGPGAQALQPRPDEDSDTKEEE